MAAAADGRLYIAGVYTDASGTYHSVVRRTTPSGWEQIGDLFSRSTNPIVIVDNNGYGTPLVCGALLSSGTSLWTVKQYQPASAAISQAPAAATAGPARKASPFSTRSILFKKRAAARLHGQHAHVR